MLLLDQLTYSIHNKNLFVDLSLTVLPSSILYIQGINGSGKTSLLRMIAGIQEPLSGKIFIGRERIDIRNCAKPFCTYVGHNLGLKLELTVFENLKYYSSIHDSLETFEASIHYFKLHDVLEKKCYELSSGNLKKVALSKLLSCQSNLWLLDEVETNLDAENKNLLNNLIISKANNGRIIILTSHKSPTIKTAQVLNIGDYILK